MHFTKALSLVATLAFSAVSFAAPLESTNHLEARCSCEPVTTYIGGWTSAAAAITAAVGTGVTVSTEAQVKASLEAATTLWIAAKADVEAYAGATAVDVWGAVPTATLCGAFVQAYAEILVSIHACTEIIVAAQASVQVDLSADVEACVAALNALTAALEVQLDATIVVAAGAIAGFKASLTACLQVILSLSASACASLLLNVNIIVSLVAIVS